VRLALDGKLAIRLVSAGWRAKRQDYLNKAWRIAGGSGGLSTGAVPPVAGPASRWCRAGQSSTHAFDLLPLSGARG
jgi:hypothetical protein